ncbi:MAG: EthD family reductase [Steroidobacteraceae bacterium]
MYSIIGVLKKPDSWTTAQFRKWWLTEHAENAKKLPGLRRYTVHPLEHHLDAVTGKLEGAPSYDGVAFLWFDDEAAARAAFASGAGQHDVQSFGETPVSVLVFGSAESREML